MARKRTPKNPLPPPPPSPSSPPPSTRKEESEKGNDITEDEDNEEQMSTDNEEDEKEEEEEEEEDDDDKKGQKVEKIPNVGEFKATAPTPSKSDSGWEMGVKKPKRTSKSRLKTAVKTDNLKTKVTTEEKVDEVEGSLEKYPALDEWLEMGNVPEGVKWVMRKRLREIEKSKVRGLEERWRSLKKAELELFVQRMDFVSEQLKLVLEAASNSADF